MGFSILFLLFETVAALALPFVLKSIVQNIETTHFSILLLLIGGFCFLWLLNKVLSDLQGIIFFPVINQAVKDLTYRLMDHLHSLPMQEQRQSNAQILSAMKRISQSARSFIRIFFLQIPMTIFHFIGSCILFIRFDLWAISIVVPIILIAWIYHQSLKWYIRQRRQAWKWTDWTTEALFDSLLSTKLARYHQKFEMNRVDEYLEKEANFWLKTNTKLHLVSIYVTVIFAIFFFISVGFFTSEKVTAGNFVLIKGLILSLFVPIRNLTRQIRQIFEASMDMETVQKIFSLSKDRNFQEKVHFQSLDLRLCQLGFSYSHQRDIFRNINMEIPFGKKVLITGESGVGKSTLCHLLAGLLQPKQGKIYLGNEWIQNYAKEHLGKILTFIPQQIHFMHASIYENLTYGCCKINMSHILEILKVVQLDILIENLPDQIHTKISEQNFPLSGGERQRLALARAFLLNPSIYVLDEAMQSLDLEKEKNILQFLLKSRSTVFVVSHRLEKSHFDMQIHLTKDQIHVVDLTESNLYALT